MAKPVPLGVRGTAEETVEFQHTLTFHHPTLPPVYSTPDMVRLMETACFHCLQPYAEGDEITVGTAIHVEHRAACGVGARVLAEATLDEQDGRVYKVAVRATATLPDGKTYEIGSGWVGRAFVSLARFAARHKNAQTQS